MSTTQTAPEMEGSHSHGDAALRDVIGGHTGMGGLCGDPALCGACAEVCPAARMMLAAAPSATSAHTTALWAPALLMQK